ncbi:MAG: YggS family pyridoxal phosphate-dependent enzyme [Gemmatimonadales bacterium]|nr:MAG: YggS family pyridoxal phosphate-dependent enzyme [Gemmatimonadales bacterium]
MPVRVPIGRLPAVEESDRSKRISTARQAVLAAAIESGRDPLSVSILPVTKGFSAEILRQVAAAGFREVGENRVAEVIAKCGVLDELALSCHMIGHLQRNKAVVAVQMFDRIDSIDSLRLARRLDAVAADANRANLAVLVQVNASGESSKGGFPVSEAVESIESICALPNLSVQGLMTMAPIDADERTLHDIFSRTRRCLEECRRQISGFEGLQLSMGMSGDFEIAIAEGATQVRLGTALLGERT